MHYKHLFELGKISNLQIKNRIVMAAMGTGLAGVNGEATDNLIKHYEERAKGETGLIITEMASVDDEQGKVNNIQLSVADNKFVPMLTRLARAVQKYDCPIFVQIGHAGRLTSPVFLGGRQPVAPSPVPWLGETPRELSSKEIKALVGKFAIGALRCKNAGIDGVEIHGAHGYLVNQFLSPHTNQRTDEYGGSFEKRMRFLDEIVHEIKAACGRNFPLAVRINADEFISEGIDLPMAQKIAQHLEGIGVDAIDVSNGVNVIETAAFAQGWKSHLAAGIKDIINIPVIAVNVIREPEFAEKMIQSGKTDFVGLARALLADPEWSKKAREGRENGIRKCISCRYCIDQVNRGRHIACAVNPRTGRDLEFVEPRNTGKRKKVVVIGGGPSGMESARELALRSFSPVLFEKKSILGGQLNVANKAVNKERINWLIDFLVNEMQRLNIDIRLDRGATLEDIQREDPYAVFIATGSTPFQPPIEGIKADHVFYAEDILSNKASYRNQNILVVGAGITGCETAEKMVLEGNKVTLIEIKNVVAKDMEKMIRKEMIKRLNDLKVKILTEHQVTAVHQHQVMLYDMKAQRQLMLGADTIVLAVGVKPEDELFETLKRSFSNVMIIGDANRTGNISTALRDGFEKAHILE